MKANSAHQAWQIDIGAAAVCLLLAFGAYYAVFSPLFNAQQKAEATRKRLQELRLHADAESLIYRAAVAQLNALDHSGHTEAARLESASHLNREVEKITDFAVACRMDVPGFQAGQFSAEHGLMVLPIHLEGSASFCHVLAFLRELPETCPGVACSSITLRNASNSEATGESSEKFSIDLQWFALPVSPPGSKRSNIITASTGQE